MKVATLRKVCKIKKYIINVYKQLKWELACNSKFVGNLIGQKLTSHSNLDWWFHKRDSRFEKLISYTNKN